MSPRSQPAAQKNGAVAAVHVRSRRAAVTAAAGTPVAVGGIAIDGPATALVGVADVVVALALVDIARCCWAQDRE